MASNKARFTRYLNAFRKTCAQLEERDAALKEGLSSDDTATLLSAVAEISSAINSVKRNLEKLQSAEVQWAAYCATFPDEARRNLEEAALETYLTADDGPEAARDHAETLLQALEKLARSGEIRLKLLNKERRSPRYQTPSLEEDDRTPSPTRDEQPPPRILTPIPLGPVPVGPNPTPPVPRDQPPPPPVLPPGPVQNVIPQPYALPRIPLPTFSGEATEYRRFFQAFDRTIHCQAAWPDVVKLNILMSSLSGAALEAVEGYDISEDSYPLVRQRLAERFGDLKLLTNSIINKILALKRPPNTYEDAVSFVDRMEGLVRQAEALGVVLESETIRMAIERSLPIWLEQVIFPIRVASTDWNLKSLRQAISKVISAGAERAGHRDKSPGSRHQRVTTMVTTSPKKSNARQARDPENSTNSLCILCEKGNHRPEECRTVPDRRERKRILREKRACFRCAKVGHWSSRCTATCAQCGQNHHVSICLGQPKGREPSKPQGSKSRRPPESHRQRSTAAPAIKDVIAEPETVAATQNKRQGLALMTANAQFINTKTKKVITASVFFDCGSSRSYATNTLMRALDLPISNQKTMMVNTFAGQVELDHGEGEVRMLLKDDKHLDLQVLTVDRIVEKIHSITIPEGVPLILANTVMTKKSPSVLIGQDHFWEIISKRRQKMLGSYDVFDSRIGKILAGRLNSEKEVSTVSVSNIVACPNFEEDDDVQMKEKVSNWIEVDAVGLSEINTDDDAMAWELFKKTTRFQDGRYVVSIPIKDADAPFHSNEGLARQQLVAWSRRATDQVKTKAQKGFEDWLRDGIIERVPEEEIDNPIGGRAVYHPFHTISKKDRVVHNGSAAKRGEASFNSRLYRGPVLLPSLVGVLIRFRVWNSVCCSDIRSAYLQLALNQPDKDLLRFFLPKEWDKPIHKENLTHMRFQRLNFGLVPSSFLLAGVLRLHFGAEGDPLGPEIIRNTYVDNIMTFGNTPDEANEKMEHAKSRLQEANMELRDLVSNDAVWNEKWDYQEESFKVLGHRWNLKQDALEFTILKPTWSDRVTKRLVLSNVAKVFDPLGVLSPIFLPYKLFIRELWKHDLGWDQPLPERLRNRLWAIEHDERDVDIMIPRKVLVPDTSELVLHLFVDASLRGLGCCAYLKDKGTTHLPHLLFAKSRLAPEKSRSIPRLELAAAYLGTKLVGFLKLEIDQPITKTILWSDNQSVLSWIARPDWEKLGVFATRKLKEMAEYPGIEYRYIPTELNPADVASRGCTPSQLLDNDQWWHGPNFLRWSESEWPKFEVPAHLVNEQPSDLFETVDPRLALVTEVEEAHVMDDLFEIQLNTVASWEELLNRMVASMDLPEECLGDRAKKGELQVFKHLQRRHPPTPKDIRSWDLFRAPDGLWRSTSRTLKGEVENGRDHPIYLPPKDPLTKLYILHVHQRLQHAAMATTLATLRQIVWLPQGRQRVKQAIRSCEGCKRFRVEPFKLPKPPALPKERLQASVPFEHVGIDLAGPFKVRNDDDQVKSIWILLSTCLATRCIHLELLHGLGATELIGGIRRFIARRGVPKSFLSDNGTNFRATAPLLVSWTPTEQDEFNKYSLEKKISWQHIPALSPWMGGVYERLIKLVKDSLRRVVGKELLTGEEFRTFVIEAEAVVNTRPLTYIGDEARLLRPIDLLTPNCRPGLPLEVGDYDPDLYTDPGESMAKERLKLQWKTTIGRLDRFWNLFYHDYILSLHERGIRGLKQSKGAVQRRPRVGERVLVHESNQPRASWRTAKITKILEGDDHQVRSAEIEMENGRRSLRSIALLYPLEADIVMEKLPTTVDRDDQAAEVDQAPAGDELEVEPRYNLRPRKPKNTSIYYVLMLLGLTSLFGPCEATCKGTVVYREACLHRGWEIRHHLGKACGEEVDCGKSHLGYSSARKACREPCRCPVWADGCVPDTITQDYKDEYSRWLKQMMPDVCWASNIDCPTASKRQLHRVELYDGRLYVVEKLELIHKQFEEPFCSGEGDVTGPPDYCRSNLCSSNGTRFCLVPRYELTYLQTAGGLVPLKAWATKEMTVFEKIPIAQSIQDDICPNTTTIRCDDQHKGAYVDGRSECIDLLEICVQSGTRQDCDQYEGLATNMSFRPPDSFLVVDHKFKITTWKDGRIEDKLTILCPAVDVCEVADCLWCWTSYTSPRCIVTHVWGASIRLVIALLSILGIVLLIRKARRYRRRPRAWGSPRRLIEMASLIAIASHGLPTTQACSEVVSLSASSKDCSVHRNGRIECRFDEATQLTLRGTDRACIMLQDHDQHPIGTLHVTAMPHFKCVKKNQFYTRVIKIETMSSRRCPGMGDCNGDFCSRVQADTMISEFKAISDRPGVSRCREACSGPGCGCFSMASACFFSRSYAEATKDEVIEVFTCDWERNLLVEWSIDDGPTEQVFLLAGEATSSGNIRIGVESVTTDTAVEEKTFASMENRTKALNNAEIEAANLLRCPTVQDAQQLGPACRLNGHAIECWQADDRILCENRGNDVLLDSNRILPQLIGANLYKKSKDDVRLEVGKGSSTIQVIAHNLVARTRIDVAKCKVIDYRMSGCYACSTGAAFTYVCTSEFGRQTATLHCGDVRAALICDGSHRERTTNIRWPEARVDTKCEVKCSGGTSALSLKAHLIYVDQRDGEKWVTGLTHVTEPSYMEWIWEIAKTAVADHLPILLSGVAILLLIPILVKWTIRIISFIL